MGVRALACWECGFESRRGQDVYLCECYVLSGRCLCVGIITRPEESYRMLFVYDREASINRRPWPTRSCYTIKVLVGSSAGVTALNGPFHYHFWPQKRLERRKVDASNEYLGPSVTFGRSFFCWFFPTEGRKDWLFSFWTCFIYLWGRLLTF